MKDYTTYERDANEYATEVIRRVVENWTNLIKKTISKDSAKVTFYFNHEIKVSYDNFQETAEKTISDFFLADEKIKEKIINEAGEKVREKLSSYGWQMSLEEENIILKKGQ